MTYLYEASGTAVLPSLGGGLGTLRAELAAMPREVSSWQIAMRSFPPKLLSPGNPGGIGKSGQDDERAWRSVPAMWTASMPDLWPVGDANVIRGYIDRALNEVNAALYNNRGLPLVTSVNIGATGGTPVYVDIPSEGLTEQDIALLHQAAGQGIVAFGSLATEMANAMAQGGSPARARALRFIANSAAQAMATIALGQYTGASIAREILQNLSNGMLAVAPSIPFGIGYIVAGVLQIGAWASEGWDHGAEPAELAGYSYHWSASQRKQVLRYRLMIQTCADPQNIAKVNSLSDSTVKSWLIKTSYGLDIGPRWSPRVDRALMNAMACASNVGGDPLDDARLIRQVSNFLWYAGVGDNVVDRIDRWLWDARRMERIHEARLSGEVNFKAPYKSIENIGLFPNYWRDWCYDKEMTPVLFTRDALIELNDYIRRKFTRQAAVGGRSGTTRRRLRLAAPRGAGWTWKEWALVAGGLAGLGALAWWLSAPREET